MEEDSKGTDLSNAIRIDEERVRDHLGRVVRGTVEETLNPGHPGQLVGERNGGDLGGAPRQKRSQPGPMLRAVDFDNSGPRRGRQQ